MSSIAFGQCDTIIKPVKRYVLEGDTFTVFTLNDERCIAQKIVRGHELAAQNQVLDQAISSFKKEREKTTKALTSADKLLTAKDSAISIKDAQLTNCEQRVVFKSEEGTKYKRQRNGALGGCGVLLVLLILL